VDADAAAELLVAANTGQEPPAPAAAPVENNQPTPTDPTPEADAGTTPEESFTNIDPNTLPPELLAQYRHMQSHFTKRTQELSEKSRALEGLDPVEARGALEFVQALNADPDFAVQVHQQLTQALENAGLTPQQASDVAAAKLEDVATGQETDWENTGTGIPPEVLARIEKTEQFMQTFQQEQQKQQITAELDRQEAEIRKRYPEWDQADIDSAYAHAYAHGGNLLAGADAYVADQGRIVSRLLAQKQTVPTGGARQGGTANAPAEAPKTMKDATAAAIEMMKHAMQD
jgi:hypothetical protein